MEGAAVSHAHAAGASVATTPAATLTPEALVEHATAKGWLQGMQLITLSAQLLTAFQLVGQRSVPAQGVAACLAWQKNPRNMTFKEVRE